MLIPEGPTITRYPHQAGVAGAREMVERLLRVIDLLKRGSEPWDISIFPVYNSVLLTDRIADIAARIATELDHQSPTMLQSVRFEILGRGSIDITLATAEIPRVECRVMTESSLFGGPWIDVKQQVMPLLIQERVGDLAADFADLSILKGALFGDSGIEAAGTAAFLYATHKFKSIPRLRELFHQGKAQEASPLRSVAESLLRVNADRFGKITKLRGSKPELESFTSEHDELLLRELGSDGVAGLLGKAGIQAPEWFND